MRLTQRARRRIPSFSLYGEHTFVGDLTNPIHIEDIPSRSRKYLWRIGTHLHQGLCQCVYLVTGAVVTDLEDSRESLAGPVVILVPAGAVHSFSFRAESQGFVLTMDLARLLGESGAPHHGPIIDLFSIPRSIDLSADAALAKRISEMLRSLLQEFREPEPLTSPVPGWLACSALWILATRSGQPSSAAAASQNLGRHDLGRLRRFHQLIEMHYRKHWTVERYARRLAMSETSLNRLCQSLAGSTAFDLIQQRLALEARRRLVHVSAPIASIAVQLGFKDPAYFSRFFRKHCGVSPSSFRRRQEAGG